ncbi:RNA polymerase sigma factor [Flavobacterium sp.]|uniref:RNA polymerase sigma factor n=1 Tax=Flavobacterium sp. TaxID=239 RepID=UPI003D0ABE0B
MLIEQLIQANHQAYVYLLEQYEKKVFNLCLSFIPNNTDAEDVAQEVFIEVFQSIGKFKKNAKLSTWIYAITKNKSLDFIRSQNAKKRKSLLHTIFMDDAERFDNLFVEFEHSGVVLENKENAEALYKAINLLPDNQRVAFTLHKMDHMSYEEVANVMETSLSSVESLLFRAKGNLKKSLKNYYKENF